MASNDSTGPKLGVFQAISAQSMVAAARDQIERAIAAGDLAPGERVNESHVAVRLGTSRGPVREAARLLEQQGLLVSSPRRGFFVREFGERDIDDLYEMRACIWGHAIRLAAGRVTPDDIADLRRRYGALLALAAAEPSHTFLDALIDFHRAICRMSGNARLARAFDELSVEIRQVIAVFGISFGRPLHTAQSQLAFITALERRDAEGAFAEVMSYVRIARDDVRRETANRRQRKGAA